MREGIGIFGGSFDPVHKGHKKLALFMCERLGLKKMLIIPTGLSPFKESSGASSFQRFKMCELAFPEDIFTVSDIEIKREGKSYTVDTVKAVKELYPHEKIYLITGSDQLLSFNRWYKFDEILRNVTLAAVSRRGEVREEELSRFADMNLRQYGECLILSFEPFTVSSTEIREKIRKGEDTSPYLTEEVIKYISTEGLYKDD